MRAGTWATWVGRTYLISTQVSGIESGGRGQPRSFSTQGTPVLETGSDPPPHRAERHMLRLPRGPRVVSRRVSRRRVRRVLGACGGCARRGRARRDSPECSQRPVFALGFLLKKAKKVSPRARACLKNGKNKINYCKRARKRNPSSVKWAELSDASAPASRSLAVMAARPRAAHKCSAVEPSRLRQLTSAPRRRSSSATVKLFFQAATCSGSSPLAERARTSAPASRSATTISPAPQHTVSIRVSFSTRN